MEFFWRTSVLSSLLLCFKFSSGQIQLVPSINSNFNQVCTSSSQCNSNAGLYCVSISPSGLPEQRCRCPTNSTTFDEYQGRCVGKVGYPCAYQGTKPFCPDKAHCSHQDPHQPDLYYHESRCFCDLNYFGGRDGKCILAAKYGESCSSSKKKCDQVSGLICVDGRCECRFGKSQYYDSKKDRCISYIGENCTGFNSCPENARCDSLSINRVKANDEKRNPSRRQAPVTISTPPTVAGRNINTSGRFNVPNPIQNQNSRLPSTNGLEKETEVVNSNIGICKCDYGFSQNGKLQCLGSFRQSCSAVQKCNHQDNLDCFDGSCNCKYPLHQVFDQTTKKCVNLIGARCNAGDSNSCVPNSSCVNGVCACNPGFSKTPFRSCLLSYSQPCSLTGCNTFKGLSCKITNSSNSNVGNGISKCVCLEETLIYNSQINSCVASFLSPCGKITHVGEYGKEQYYVPCENNLVCAEDPGGNTNTRFCRHPIKDL